MATTAEKIGYDHILDQRVKQLREIDERLEVIHDCDRIDDGVRFALRLLRDGIARMIRAAQEEYDAF